MNNEICPKCETKIEEGSIYCYNCGTKLIENNIQNSTISINNNQNINNEKEGDILGIISILLYFAGSTILSFIISILPESTHNYLSGLVGLCPLASIVVMIVGRIKYPKNKLLKIAMWTILISILLGIIILIVMIVLLFLACSSVAPKGGC